MIISLAAADRTAQAVDRLTVAAECVATTIRAVAFAPIHGAALNDARIVEPVRIAQAVLSEFLRTVDGLPSHTDALVVVTSGAADVPPAPVALVAA